MIWRNIRMRLPTHAVDHLLFLPIQIPWGAIANFNKFAWIMIDSIWFVFDSFIHSWESNPLWQWTMQSKLTNSLSDSIASIKCVEIRLVTTVTPCTTLHTYLEWKSLWSAQLKLFLSYLEWMHSGHNEFILNLIRNDYCWEWRYHSKYLTSFHMWLCELCEFNFRILKCFVVVVFSYGHFKPNNVRFKQPSFSQFILIKSN